MFRKLNKNRKNKAQSAGTHPDYLPVSKTVKRALRTFGIKKVDSQPHDLTKKLIKWADIIVVSADNTNVRAPGKQVLKWSITDTTQGNYKGVLARSADIKKRIKRLLSTLD